MPISITAKKSELSAALARLSRVVEKRNTIPILSNLCLEVDGSKLTVIASDLEIEMRTVVDVIADMANAGPAGITVNASTLTEIVRKAPDGDLSISWDGATPMQIKVGRFRSALPTLPAQDFPELDPDWRNGMPTTFTVSADALAAILAPVAFAISTEETRYYLNGVYLHAVEVEDGVTKLRAVSTDGHRLARRDIPAPDGSAGLSGVILPRKTVGELLRLAKDGGDIELGVSASKIRAKTGQSVLVSKLIDGTFPDYQRVIPSNNKSRAVVNRKALSEAADRAGTVSSGDAKAIKLAFGPAGLTVSMNNSDTGSAAEEIDATFSAAPIEIGFNGRYLADALSNLAGEEIAIDLNEGSSPTLFRPLDDDSLLIVLMPMRIQ